MIDKITLFQWLTAFVAIYGAGLATINAVQQSRKDRKRVKVQLSWGMIANRPTAAGGVFIEVQNTGFRPVEIAAIQFRLPNGKALVFTDLNSTNPLPHKLDEGRSQKAWVPARRLATVLTEHGFKELDLVAECRDSLGKAYRSKPLNVSVDALGKLDP